MKPVLRRSVDQHYCVLDVLNYQVVMIGPFRNSIILLKTVFKCSCPGVEDATMMQNVYLCPTCYHE